MYTAFAADARFAVQAVATSADDARAKLTLEPEAVVVEVVVFSGPPEFANTFAAYRGAAFAIVPANLGASLADAVRQVPCVLRVAEGEPNFAATAGEVYAAVVARRPAAGKSADSFTGSRELGVAMTLAPAQTGRCSAGVGGTATGKTTLLSALCHGIPNAARIVKIEDPEEIWVPHPNVTTLEARWAPPGSNVPSYTVADGVDDALRLAPTYVIVGEVRRGDATLALFRAMMSDHAGLTTFHADGPEHAAYRISIIMYSDAAVRTEAARGMFAEAVDLVVQIGWRTDRRVGLGGWWQVSLSIGAVMRDDRMLF